ncbi:hypothetical protein VOLCADRAFT_100946 [Volvox carteri f. nagariensis]|uniref:Uncharacterized protein n=1 Tax=Volvox carteri f. nagariensis TaxID=3068 RepID=D8ULE1_VOLCA|nr:uncharacterized protein VOLCADRAFT_100946 [Volvox carteri f. nagariensis]EFJ39457.1 hypothetical protein VOLCADRAFT_100946 [Volvox carteri f. nagariensis]|eukprot:XP_002959476.1 hypothetical protein VOLCADRAFT_100946 [Volvox carteri f. nagariensis]
MPVAPAGMHRLLLARERGVAGSQDALAFKRSLHFPVHYASKLSVEHTYEGHNGCVNRLGWNADGSLLVSGSDDRRAIIWHYPDVDRPPLALSTEHRLNIFGVQFLPCTGDRRIVTGAMDNTVQLHDMEASPMSAAAAARAVGRQGAAGSRAGDHVLRRRVAAANVRLVVPRTKVYLSHRDRVKDVKVEPMNPHNFWSCGEDGVVRQFDTRLPNQDSFESPTVLLQVYGKREVVQVKSLDINKAHPHLVAVAGSDVYIRLYDRRKLSTCTWKGGADTAALMRLAPPHLPLGAATRPTRAHATYVSFSNRGDKVVTSYHADHAYCFDITSAGDLAARFPQPPAPAPGPSSASIPISTPIPAHASSRPLPGRLFMRGGGRGGCWGGGGGGGGGGVLAASWGAMPKEEDQDAEEEEKTAAFGRSGGAAGEALLERGWAGDAALALRDCDTATSLDESYSRAFLGRIQALQVLQQYQNKLSHLTKQLRSAVEERRKWFLARRQQQQRRRRQRAAARALTRTPRRTTAAARTFPPPPPPQARQDSEPQPATADAADNPAATAAAANRIPVQRRAGVWKNRVGGRGGGDDETADGGLEDVCLADAEGGAAAEDCMVTEGTEATEAAEATEATERTERTEATERTERTEATGVVDGTRIGSMDDDGGDDDDDDDDPSDDDEGEDEVAAADTARGLLDSRSDIEYDSDSDCGGQRYGSSQVDLTATATASVRHMPGGAWYGSAGGRRMLQRYVGQCNVQTDIKEVNFIGCDDRVVAAGSDCGRVFLYDADTGAVLRALAADEDVANCVQCHPTLPVLATSGIENVIRLWSPRDAPPAAEAVPELEQELRSVVDGNQERMNEGPSVFRPSALQDALQENPQLLHLFLNQLYGNFAAARRGGPAGQTGSGGSGGGGDGQGTGMGGGNEGEGDERPFIVARRVCRVQYSGQSVPGRLPGGLILEGSHQQLPALPHRTAPAAAVLVVAVH